MEEAPGTQIQNLWDKMTPDSKLAVMREVVSLEAKLSSLSFSQYVSVLVLCSSEYNNLHDV